MKTDASPDPLETLYYSQIRLPSLPTVVVELIENLGDTKTDVSLLVEKISQDQAIVARVMRLANSPFYGFSGRVRSIRDAVLMLGFHDVRNLVIATALMKLTPVGSADFDWHNFWHHSFTVAVCCRLLAKQTRQSQEAAFLAGIVHDIGVLVVGVCLPEQFARILEYQREKDVLLLEAERAILHTDHAKIGARVARYWLFPDDICHAVENHHNPAPIIPAPLTDIVYVANLLCAEMESGGSDVELSAFLAEEMHMRLGLDQNALEQVIEQIRLPDIGSILT